VVPALEGKESVMNAAMQERLRFIDFLLDHYGTLQRAAVMDYFGVSTPQASLDIRAYIAQAPDNLHYDPALRVYRRGEHFKRVYP
jgi:hypothetical protein